VWAEGIFHFDTLKGNFKRGIEVYLVSSFSQWISIFWKWMFANFSTSFVVSGSACEINNTIGFWAAFRVPLPPCQFCALFSWWLQLSTLNHALFSDCSFHCILNRVWLCLPLFAVFSSCWEDVIFGWRWLRCRLDTGIRLVCCTLCICFLGLMWSATFRLLYSIWWLAIHVC